MGYEEFANMAPHHGKSLVFDLGNRELEMLRRMAATWNLAMRQGTRDAARPARIGR
jgi:hypothetical protein